MKKWVVLAVAAVIPLAWVGQAALCSTEAAERGRDSAQVVRQDLTSVVKATGVVRVENGAEVRVGSRATGEVQRLYVAIGERVHKGQLLAQLDVRELVVRRDQAAATLLSARANLDFASADCERKRTLAAHQAIPQSELDLAERSLATAHAALAEVRANLAFAELQIAQTRIVAPIEGVVAAIGLQEGELVAPGSTAPTLMTLVDLQRLEVLAYVDETDIGQVRMGQRARFTVDTYSGRELEGTVTAIRPKPEIRDNVVSYVVVVEFAPPQEQPLRPEMTANVKIVLQARERVLTVPRRAVRRAHGKTYVLCPQGEGVVRRSVKTGSWDESHWEIVEGLKEGETVLLGEAAEEAAGQGGMG
ncbi:MAG: efflux RND transporter periplasmic adaptor subunit [Deltaproteobacteria bacterium]|nr:efflux RND transporter periplasmic adaptor subunit [Deltaproteobacteria bacterium]